MNFYTITLIIQFTFFCDIYSYEATHSPFSKEPEKVRHNSPVFFNQLVCIRLSCATNQAAGSLDWPLRVFTTSQY